MQQVYLGTKIVVAEPETKDGRDGYAIVYPDGYRSWSPKDVFERSYRLVSAEEAVMIAPAPMTGRVGVSRYA